VAYAGSQAIAAQDNTGGVFAWMGIRGAHYMQTVRHQVVDATGL